MGYITDIRAKIIRQPLVPAERHARNAEARAVFRNVEKVGRAPRVGEVVQLRLDTVIGNHWIEWDRGCSTSLRSCSTQKDGNGFGQGRVAGIHTGRATLKHAFRTPVNENIFYL